MWSFVGVMMALLIMFMSLPSGTQHKSVDLVMARFAVAQPNAPREDVIKITLTRDGRVFFGYIQVHSDEIAEIIESNQGRRREEGLFGG